MAPDFPSLPSRPQITPGNVQNQKRGGRGGKARKRRRRRADGTWEEVDDDEEGEDDPSVELDGDSFRAKQGEGALDDFMDAALPWETDECAVDEEEVAEAPPAVATELPGQPELPSPGELAAGWGDVVSPERVLARQTASPPAPPPPPPPVAPPPPPPPPVVPPPAPNGRGTGGLQLPRGTGDLGPLQQRRGTGSLGKPGAAGPSPYLQGSWEYRTIDGRTGYPVVAVIELVFMEARVVPVRRKQQADAQGWSRGQGLPPGRYQLTVGAPGYHPQSEVRFLRPDAPDRGLFRLQAI